MGAVGTALGEAGANIANMSLARNDKRDKALTVIEIDGPLDPAVMEQIRAVPGILSATGVTL